MTNYKVYILFFCLILSFQSHGQKTIDLSGQNLTLVPRSILNEKEITTLKLSGNPLVKLPEWLPELPQLKTIILDSVQSLNVVESFALMSQCSQLEYLSWSNGKLVFIPTSINDFKRLTILKVAENGILKMPLIVKKLPLTHLDISDNLIDSLGTALLQLSKLKCLNFSFNPGTKTENNYHILQELTQLDSLFIGGLSEIPSGIKKLTQLKFLSLAKNKIKILPPSIGELQQLKNLNLEESSDLIFSESIEQLANLNQLSQLSISGAAFEKLPYNIFKLRQLKELNLKNTCIQFVPSSIKQLNITNLNLVNCTIGSSASNLTERISSIKSLKNLQLNALVFPAELWDLKKLNSLRLNRLDLRDNNLQNIPSFNNVDTVLLKGNEIEISQISQLKTTDRIDEYTQVAAADKKLSQLKYKSSGSEAPSQNEANFVKPFKKIIYTQIGDKFKVGELEIEIPPYAFLDKNSKVIEGEVVISITVIQKASDIASNQLTFFDRKGNVFDNKINFEIQLFEATKTGTETTLENAAFVNQKKPIKISYLAPSNNSYQALYYQKDKNHWEVIPHVNPDCNTPPIYKNNQKNNKNKNQNNNQKSFKSTVYSNSKNYPTPDFKVRNSKVEMRIKRNKRRGTLNFEITPEYGYRESFFQLFGDKIKGYPELKVYKGIKWLYVGDSLENDLKKLYFLSEQANSEKLDRKSTFYFYVLDIMDISIKPHPNKDNYVISIVQGKDTARLDVLPQLQVIKAKKIQKWHRKKYNKYSKELVKRRENWLSLDSAYFSYFANFEKQLTKFRAEVIAEHLIQQAQFDNEAKKTNFSETNNSAKNDFSFFINKTGLYGVGNSMLLNNASVSKNINLLISGRKHYAKYVLVRNNLSKQTYWQNTAKASFSSKGDNYVFSLVGNQLYFGKFEAGKPVYLNKF